MASRQTAARKDRQALVVLLELTQELTDNRPLEDSLYAVTEAALRSARTRRRLKPVRSAIASVDGEPGANRSSSRSARWTAASRPEALDGILMVRASTTASASERRIHQTA